MSERSELSTAGERRAATVTACRGQPTWCT